MHTKKVNSDKGAGEVRGSAAARRADNSDKIFKVGEWRGHTRSNIRLKRTKTAI